MIPVYMTLSSASPPASTPWKNADFYRAPFQLSIGVVATGTVNYTVQYTYDDLLSPGAPAPTGIFSDTALNAATATGETTFNNPITAWRVMLNSGNGSLAIKAIQAGMP